MFLQKWYEPIFLRPACYLDLNLRKIKRWSDACWSRPRLLQLFTKQFSLFLFIMSIDSLLRQIIIILLWFWLEKCKKSMICWESAQNLLRLWSKVAQNLMRICSEFVENLLIICWESAQNLLRICWDSAENLLRRIDWWVNLPRKKRSMN